MRKLIVFMSLYLFNGALLFSLAQPAPNVWQVSSAKDLHGKRTKEQRQRLKPNIDDTAKYADFLQQKGTGLFRLMPDFGCESNIRILRADEPCLNSIVGGAFYSFRARDYTNSLLSDIRLKNGILISDGLLSEDILVSLGDVPLENISPESDGVKFLIDFVPETKSKDVAVQIKKLMAGIQQNGYFYANQAPPRVDQTYALRAIAFRGKYYKSFNGLKVNLLENDKRMDLTVAFRVVRKDADGGITLLWKELSRRESPRVIFPKKDESKDIRPSK